MGEARKTPNPYDQPDVCTCSAWSPGECACGGYVDRGQVRAWDRGYEAAAADRDAGLRERPLIPREQRSPIAEPFRGTPPVTCQHCGAEVEAHARVTVGGLAAGYRWRHVETQREDCHQQRWAQPYDEYAAERSIRAALAADPTPEPTQQADAALGATDEETQ